MQVVRVLVVVEVVEAPVEFKSRKGDSVGHATDCGSEETSLQDVIPGIRRAKKYIVDTA
jgi:hypothetical protein